MTTRRLLVAAFLVTFSLTPAWAAEIGLTAQINGTPMLLRAGQSTALVRGSVLQPGDEVSTDEASKAKLLLSDDSVLTIGPRSRVRLDDLQLDVGRKGRLSILVGRFKFAVAKYLGGPTDYEINTPTAVAGVRGTVLWGDTERDTICALDGKIKVRPKQAKQAAALADGQCVSDMAAGKTTAVKPTPEQLAAYLKEVTLQ